MTSEPQKEGIFANRSAVILAIVAGLALLTTGILGGLLIRGNGDGEANSDGTPTPFSSAVESYLEGSAPLVVGDDGSSQISVTVDFPTTLLIDGRSFSVQPQTVGEDRIWTPTIADEETAVWVYGSIINYVIGIPESEENRALLEQLTTGDEFSLTTRGGFEYGFSFDSRETVNSATPDLFAQNMPGITLMLIGSEGNERLVVNGRYILSETNTAAANVADLGETVQLDNLQITVPSVAFVPDRPEAPAGFAFFQIDFDIQNIGLSAIDTSILQLTLIDNLGNQYAISPIAGQVGNHPTLAGFLNAGQTIQATAGYQIPLGLNSESLNWVVARADTGAQVQVNVPFTGNAATVAQSSDITLLQATVGDDLTSLMLAGQITNLNTQPIVITESDIDLASGGAAYLLLATNPPFPWTVASGQTLQFNVTYQRPSAETAVFTVLSQSFQLDGLR